MYSHRGDGGDGLGCVGSRSGSASHQSHGACWARKGGEHNLRDDDGGRNDRRRVARGNYSPRLAAGNDDSARNSYCSDGSSCGVGGRPRDRRRAREDCWVGTDLIHAKPFEIGLSGSDFAIGCTVSVKALVDRAHESL